MILFNFSLGRSWVVWALSLPSPRFQFSWRLFSRFLDSRAIYIGVYRNGDSVHILISTSRLLVWLVGSWCTNSQNSRRSFIQAQRSLAGYLAIFQYCKRLLSR